jgi:predicted CoA-binding protein
MAIKKLLSHGHEVKAIGLRNGEVDGVEIEKGKPNFKDIHTILMYINPENQKEYYGYILSLKPKRIIFNPGAENPELEKLAEQNGIVPIEACSLVMLSTGQF